MRGEDDDWSPVTDARASERRSGPRPPDTTKTRARRALAGLAGVNVADRLSLTCGLAADWIVQCYRAEIDAGNTFVWAVASLAAGAALYLALPHEPSIIALCVVAGVAAGALILRHRIGAPFPVTLTAMAAIGLWAAALEAQMVATPRLDHDRTAAVTGWVLDAETVLNGATRMTISVVGMTAYRLPAEAVPRRISVTFRKGSPRFAVGDGIRFLARLRPLPGPVMPGGYDFARRSYFEGRGGTGYALGRIEHADPGERPWAVWFAAGIFGLRYTMAERIRTALPGAEGAIAAAIIVGETRAIPDAENDALRMSGLPHMITIAGLHMSIVASSVFFGVRFLLSLVPAIALRWPTKRIAAAASLVAITFYVLMAGPHISAERAYVMAAIMLVATILGRPALTMRNLALSAVVLIAVNPAQVVEPGFQMSFLAVAALIAAYQALSRYRLARSNKGGHRRGDRGLLHHVVHSGFSHMSGAAWSSLIATLATASVTADQFYRVPPYGAITNFIVLPAIDMVAMPCAVLTCLLMPFGLEALPLALMGKSIDFMLTVGAYASALPGGQGLIGRIHPLTNLLAIAGILWLCLWQQPWRLLGIAPLALAIALAPFSERPDVMIGEGARPVAVRDATGQLRILATKQDRFTVANWLMADAAANTPANTRAPLDPALSEGWRCDAIGCVFVRPPDKTGQALTVAVVLDARAFEEDCLRADILITRLAAPAFCRQTTHVIDRAALDLAGAMTLRVSALNADPPRVSDSTSDTPMPANRWQIAETHALADPSRAWRLSSKPLPGPAVPQPASTELSRPKTSFLPESMIDDPTVPPVTDAFIRDLTLATDPTQIRGRKQADPKRPPPTFDPGDVLEAPDVP